MKHTPQSQLQERLFIGLMSGTSCDGIDASLVRTDGDKKFSSISDIHIEYDHDFQQQLLSLCINPSYHDIARTEQTLTQLHVQAVLELIRQAGVSTNKIHAIGFHGHTISHQPVYDYSLQIGNPYHLGRATGIEQVIYDFRRRDISNGGQGAPLVPIFHKLLAHKSQEKEQQGSNANNTGPVAIVNIGGVANISYIDSAKDLLISFDTGPGNALINDLTYKYYNKFYDKDGLIADTGTVNQEMLDELMAHEYFSRTSPKSLDRNYFVAIKETLLSRHNLTPQDKISTATAFTAKSIALSLKQLFTTSINTISSAPSSIFDIPNPQILKIYLCGGGRKNKSVVNMLGRYLQNLGLENVTIEDICDATDLNGDFIESQAFAYLAARYIARIPSSFYDTTGTSEPTIAGCLCPATVKKI